MIREAAKKGGKKKIELGWWSRKSGCSGGILPALGSPSAAGMTLALSFCLSLRAEWWRKYER